MAEDQSQDKRQPLTEVASRQQRIREERKGRGSLGEPDLSGIFPLRSNVISQQTSNTGGQNDTTTSTDTGGQRDTTVSTDAGGQSSTTTSTDTGG